LGRDGVLAELVCREVAQAVAVLREEHLGGVSGGRVRLRGGGLVDPAQAPVVPGAVDRKGVHPAAGVVDVVLTLDAVTGGGEHVGERIADGGPARGTEGYRPGG